MVCVCKKTRCKDYLTDEGDPAWCRWAGMPASVAVKKCPKVTGNENEGKNDIKRRNRH